MFSVGESSLLLQSRAVVLSAVFSFPLSCWNMRRPSLKKSSSGWKHIPFSTERYIWVQTFQMCKLPVHICTHIPSGKQAFDLSADNKLIDPFLLSPDDVASMFFQKEFQTWIHRSSFPFCLSRFELSFGAEKIAAFRDHLHM